VQVAHRARRVVTHRSRTVTLSHFMSLLPSTPRSIAGLSGCVFVTEGLTEAG